MNVNSKAGLIIALTLCIQSIAVNAETDPPARVKGHGKMKSEWTELSIQSEAANAETDLTTSSDRGIIGGDDNTGETNNVTVRLSRGKMVNEWAVAE